MSKEEQDEIARKYVNEQLEAIKTYRAEKREISSEDYEKAVKKVAEALLNK
jgi:hypothetical protein